jgi:hypothetical protein
MNERATANSLQRSLRRPHPETVELAEVGFQDWAATLPEEDTADLVDLQAGKEVRWVPGKGWTEISDESGVSSV